MNDKLYTISEILKASRINYENVMEIIRAARISGVQVGKRTLYPHDALAAVMKRRQYLDSPEGKAAVLAGRMKRLADGRAARKQKAAEPHAVKAPDPSAPGNTLPLDMIRDTYSLVSTVARDVLELRKMVEQIKDDNKAQGKLSMAHIAALNELIGTEPDDTEVVQ